MGAAANREIERLARDSYGKLVAYLASSFRNTTEAEDAISEAFVAALKRWSEDGVPRNPEAWLLTTAKRKLVDRSRHLKVRQIRLMN